jgi:hypothetical protein
VCFVSAQEALKGRSEGLTELVEASGIAQLESVLSGFVVNERSEAKLATPLRLAEHAAEEALLVILVRRVAEWDLPRQKMQAAWKNANGCVEAATKVREQLKPKLEWAARRLRLEASKAAAAFVKEHADEVWRVVDAVTVSNWDAIFGTSASVKRIVEAVAEWLEKRAKIWDRERLTPLVAEHGHEVMQQVNDAIAELQGIADAAVDLEREALQLEGRDRTDENRRGASGAGLGGSGVPSGIEGVSVDMPIGPLLVGAGIGAVAGGIIGTWATATLLLALPVILFVIVTGLVGAVLGMWNAGDVLKARVSSRIKATLEEALPELEASMLAKVGEHCTKVIDAVEESTRGYMATIRDSREAIARRLREDEERAAAREVTVEELRRRLQDLRIELDALRREIDPRYNAERLADRIGRHLNTRSVQKDGDAALSGDGPHPLPELKSKLGPDWERLRVVQQYLAASSRWQNEMAARIAELWIGFRKKAGSTAVLQEHAYRTVTVLAVTEGSLLPPTPTEVRRRYKDPAYETDVVRLHTLISGAEDASYFDDKDESGQAKDRFCKAYEHAYLKVHSSSSDGQAHPGTVVDGDSRDRPRSS